MQDDHLRALIREAIARHLFDDGRGRMTDTSSCKTHVSHGRFVFLAPTEPDAPCVVEPHVRCHHCGFCQSYGH